MDNTNYFKDLFESIPDYREIVIKVFLLQNDKEFKKKWVFLMSDINGLCFEFENFLLEQSKEYLDDIRNEEESISEKFLNK